MWSSINSTFIKFKDFLINAAVYTNHLLVNEDKRRKIILFSLVFVLLITLLISDYRPGHDDPGGDSSLVVNGAINIKNGNGYTFNSIWVFDEGDGNLRTDISKPAYFYPPLTSLILAIFFMMSESLFLAILVQILFFGLIVLFYHDLVTRLFNEKIAFWSALMLIFNPLIIFEVVSVPRTHILGLLLIITYFTVQKRLEESEKAHVVAGIIAGFAYLTRDVNLALFFSGIIVLLIKRNYAHIAKFSASFFIVVTPWMVRNYVHYGTFLTRATIGYNYEPAGIEGGSSPNIDTVIIIVRHCYSMIYDLSSPHFFFILLPFVLFGLLTLKDYKKYQSLLSFVFIYMSIIVFAPLLTPDAGYQKIYMIPFFVLTLPFGFSSLFDISEKYKINLGEQGLNPVTVLLILILVISLTTIVKDELGTKMISSTVDPLEDYEWSKQNLEPESRVALAGRMTPRFHYYTNMESITLPINLDNSSFQEFILDYKINYIFFEKDSNYENTKPYSDLDFGHNSIYYEKFTLKKINEQSSIYDGAIILIYEVDYGEG